MKYIVIFGVLFCSITNFACMEGHIYCKPHFMEIFMTKGEREKCTLHVIWLKKKSVLSVAVRP